MYSQNEIDSKQSLYTSQNKDQKIESKTAELTKLITSVKGKKNDVKLVFENNKKGRGTEFRVFTDGGLEFKGGVNSYGVHITNEVVNWKQLPASKNDDEKIVFANYYWTSEYGVKKRVEGVKSKIYHNEYSIYIKPMVEDENNLQLKTNTFCEIPGYYKGKEQLVSTSMLSKSVDLLEKINFNELANMRLIASEWIKENTFSLYQDVNNQLYGKFTARLGKTGSIKIPDGFRNYIDNLFVKNIYLVYSINNETPKVTIAKLRSIKSEKKNRKDIMEFFIPYIGSQKTVEIKITNPNLKLNKKAKQVLKIREMLQQNGFAITNFKDNARELGCHKSTEIEFEYREFIERVFKDDKNATVFHEAEIITTRETKQIKEATKHTIDIIVSVIDIQNNPKLINIELKTEISDNWLIDEGLDQLYHLEKALKSNNVLSILFVNGELINNYGKVLTQEFGEKIGIRIIGKQEFEVFKNKPELFKEIIKEFEIRKQKHNKIMNYGNKSNLLSLEQILPSSIRIIGVRSYEGEGKDFENRVREELIGNTTEIFENLQLAYFDRKMELDFITFNNDGVSIIECIDKSNMNIRSSVIDTINEVASQLEWRVDILNANTGVLYAKVNFKDYKIITRRYNNKKWSKRVTIKIRKK